MKVLFDARTITPHYPGIGRYAAGLLGALAETLGEDVIAVRNTRPDEFTPPVGSALLRAHPRALADQLLSPIVLAARFKPSRHIYHSPFYLFPYVLPHPVVVTLYDLTPRHSPFAVRNSQFAIRNSLFTILSTLAAKRARHIITLSAAARAELVRGLRIPADRITVIPPGAPHGAGVGVDRPVDRLTAQTLGAPSSSGYLLYVGTNKPHKNLARLILAYSRLHCSAPPLVIAGPLDERYPHAQQLAESQRLGNRVRFLGRVPEADLPDLYRNATLFVFPSLAEGFGFPALEAMAFGAPLICSDIPALRELAGDAALYFVPERIDSVTQALAEGLARPELRHALRERGLARARAFSWQAAAEQTVGVYRRVAADG